MPKKKKPPAGWSNPVTSDPMYPFPKSDPWSPQIPDSSTSSTPPKPPTKSVGSVKKRYR